MTKPSEIFTPNDVPTITYVQRPTHKLEERLREAFEVPKMIISISGPSKSGKTVLVNKVVEADNLIPLTGATIRSADELWSNVLQWMEAPYSRSEKTGTTIKLGAEANAEGKAGIPFLAEAKAGGKASAGLDRASDVTKNFRTDGLYQVAKEIAQSNFVVFVDDFHYIPKNVQEEIGRQIKAAAETGIRICTASVPHRQDDVVRSNTELRGRVMGIDSGYWSHDELAQIADQGFRELNVDLSPRVVRQLVAEAFGSPQLMQAICLNFCFENGIKDTLPRQERIDPDFVAMQQVFERTSTLTNFSSMISQLHSGPRQRGMDRKVYHFKDGSKGDVYRCVLLAIKSDPPQLAFTYDAMLKRVASVCEDESPSGSSVSQALEQMDKLAKMVQEAPVIEWDADVLDIIEPYFLFFLRSSNHVKSLA